MKTDHQSSTIIEPSDERFIVKFLGSRLANEFRDILGYAFNDIHESEVDEIHKHLVSKVKKESCNDKKIFEEIFSWYVAKDESSRKGFSKNYADYMKGRADNIAEIIKASSKVKESKVGEILDIGSGNGALSSFISEAMNMKLTAIDIETEAAEKWGSTKENDHISKITRVIYDGENLEGVFAAEGKKFDVILYNNSLHHFPSFRDQKKSVRQALNLLKPGGVIFFTEHENIMNDPSFNLIHLLLSLRHQIDRIKAKKDVSSEVDIESQLKYAKDVCGEPKYFSPTLLTNLCKELGLEAQIMQPNYPADVSRSISYSFVKPLTKDLDIDEERKLPSTEIKPYNSIDGDCDFDSIRRNTGISVEELKKARNQNDSNRVINIAGSLFVNGKTSNVR